MHLTGTVFSALALAASVVAHGGVTGLSIGSTQYAGWQPYNGNNQASAERPYTSYNPILNASDPTLHCNNNGAEGPSQQTITIAAGSTIRATYAQWTHLPGPYTVYLASCGSGSCNGVNAASVQWFKIYELGLISGSVGNGSWANGLLLNNLYWDTTIPANIKPGNYLIRWETLAIHQANTPQWYPECAQLLITGSGTVFPTSDYMIPIPGGWSQTDPGADIDIYAANATSIFTYAIPGPRVYPAFGVATPPNLPGSSSGSTSVASTSVPAQSTSVPVQSTTTPVQTTTAPVQTTTSSSQSLAQHYGQCGGTGWTGPTACVSPYSCKATNSYYSQCV